MEAGSKHRYRAPVPIEGRVADKLVVERDVDCLAEAEVVIELEDLLVSVGKSAVACQDPSAAGSEKPLVGVREAVEHAGKANDVVGPMPRLASDADARGGSAVDVAEDPGA